MFEEVPRGRRGLAASLGVGQLTARRIVLGPFVIGGSVILAAVGGSVAVAATVLTASTIRASDTPPHPHPSPVVITTASSAGRPSAHRAVPSASATPTSPTAVPAQPSAPGVGGSLNGGGATDGGGPTEAVAPIQSSSDRLGRTGSAANAPSLTSSPTASIGTGSAGAPSTSPSPTASPAGNATVYVSGWNANTKQLIFEFAAVSQGTGPQHSDVYSIASSHQYTASLASDLRVVSGGLLCPPAGSTCTVDQLIAGTAQGFYAVVAVDPSAAVHEVSERDNQTQNSPPAPSASPSSPPTPGPQVSIQPASRPTASQPTA